MAPSTPPPAAVRPHTPPTPLHGPQHDTYEPYSPRRSKRSTAQTNPYGSFNVDRSPKTYLQRATTPPTTGKRARFTSTQLSSPPSSPSSPVTRASAHKTPRKTPASKALNGAQSDSDSPARSLVPGSSAASAMFPTPNKTPKKRKPTTMSGTARILNFQLYSPNDVMPSARKMKKRSHSMRNFDLYDESAEPSQEQIEVYTDSNARVPTLDGAEDNPFLGTRQTPEVRRPRRVIQARNSEEREMEEMAARNEGIIYVFRGKKVFRRFEANEDARRASSPEPEPDYAQRSLRRQAGESAQRPLTRSSIKPRRLFETKEQLRERQQERERELAAATTAGDVDEEAVTDIEMPVTTKGATPSKANSSKLAAAHLATPPSTKRVKRTVDRAATAGPAGLDAIEEEFETLPASPVARKAAKVKVKSPFDDWPRVKGKGGRKREAPQAEEGTSGSSKRTRS